MLDRSFAHQHHQTAGRITKRTTRSAGVALGTGPDLFLHCVVNTFEILSPQQLDNFARAKVVVVRGRTGRGANTAIQATIKFMVITHIALQILEDLFQFSARQYGLLGDWVAGNFLNTGCGGMGHDDAFR